MPEALLEWLLAAGEWYLQPGFRRLSPQYVTELLDSTSSPRSPWFEQLRRLTVPPQALLVRRMEGLVFSTLGELRAGADWFALAKRVLRRRARRLSNIWTNATDRTLHRALRAARSRVRVGRPVRL